MRAGLITRDTDYAVRALVFMAGQPPGTRFTVSRLAGKLDLPHPFLRRIVQVMTRAGLLRSFRGRDGGFELAASPAEIRLNDLLNIFQGPLSLSGCLFRKRVCPARGTCPLRHILLGLEKKMAAELSQVSIATLCDLAEPGRPDPPPARRENTPPADAKQPPPPAARQARRDAACPVNGKVTPRRKNSPA